MGRFLDSMRSQNMARDRMRQEYEDHIFGQANTAQGTRPVEEAVLEDARPGGTSAYEVPGAAEATRGRREVIERTRAAQNMQTRGYVDSMRGKMAVMDEEAAANFIQSRLGQGLTSMEIVREGMQNGISQHALLKELTKPQYRGEDAPPPPPDTSVGRWREIEQEQMRPHYRGAQPTMPISPPDTVIQDATVARFRRARAGGDMYGPTLESVSETVPTGESKMMPRGIHDDMATYMERRRNYGVVSPAMQEAPSAMMLSRREPVPVPYMPRGMEYMPRSPLPEAAPPMLGGTQPSPYVRELALAASRPAAAPIVAPSGMEDIALGIDMPAPRPAPTMRGTWRRPMLRR